MSGPIFLILRLLIAASLYVFLGWAFVSLWRDIRQQATLLSARRVPPIDLTIQQGDTPPKPCHFTQAEITVGRDPACEIPVDDEAVSARHARLAYHHGQWWLEDLNSTNGTLLNQEKVLTPTVVISGDTFKCGRIQFTIAVAGDTTMPPSKEL